MRQIAALLDNSFAERQARLQAVPVLSPEVELVVRHAHMGGFTVSSDFARANAIHVAEAASRGFITTFDHPGNTYCRTWHVTENGLRFMRTYQ